MDTLDTTKDKEFYLRYQKSLWEFDLLIVVELHVQHYHLS